MNILAIDTTTKTAAVTLKKDNEIFEESITNEITHSEKLLPIISNTLEKSTLTLDNLDLLGIINGPGSFTGIRIGVATLKAIAQVKNLNIFSISSTTAISYVAFNKLNNLKYFVSLIDARNDRVYFKIEKVEKDCDGKIDITTILPTDNMVITEAIENISCFFDNNKISKEDICIAGKGVDKFTSIFTENGYVKENLLELYPTPRDLINLYTDIKNPSNYIFNAFSLDANYERKSQAERMSKNGK